MKTIIRYCILLALFASAFASSAQTKNLYSKKLKTGRYLTMGSFIYFISNDSLLKADAKFTKVRLVKKGLSNPDQFTLMNDKFYFVNHKTKLGNDSAWTELWVCNGTAAGTLKVKSFKGVSILISHNTSLYLAAADNLHGTELWISNGTDQGTRMIKDINEGVYSSLCFSLMAVSPVIYQNKVYLAATDKFHGRELWKCDGTNEGTQLVKDIEPGIISSDPTLLTVSGDYLYFASKCDNISGNSISSILNKSDGTDSGTSMIKNFNGEKFCCLSHFVDVKGTLFFTLEQNINNTSDTNELWRTNGTAWNTEMVIEVEN